MQAVAAALHGVAASVTILELPNLPPKGDVSDWLDSGGTKDMLIDLATEAARAAKERQRAGDQFAVEQCGDSWEHPHDRLHKPWANGKPAHLTTGAITLDAYVPFPTETLPVPQRDFVDEGAKALGVEAAFVALPALATMAGCIGATRVLELKRTWREPPILWTGLVADSGTVKTPAWEMTTNPVYRVQAEHRQRYRRELADFRRSVRAASRGEVQPIEPVYKRIITSDTTIEKLASILEENPRGLLVSNDELSAWLNSFARYKGKAGGSDLPQWLSMHRGGPIIVDRKTGPSLFVERGVVSITGTIQPGTLSAVLSQQFFDAGLPARLLLAMPPSQQKKWTEIEVSPEVGQTYRNLIAALLSLEFDGEPVVIRMDSDAKAIWVQFYDEWALEQTAVEGDLLAAFAKLEAYAARFALGHHVCMHTHLGIDDRVPLTAESMAAGVQLARWFGNEARRVYSMLAESDEQRARRKLVEFIKTRGGRITARELQRSNNRKYRSAEEADGALCGLANAGVAHWLETPEGTNGRPTRILELTMHDR
jgi:hypothetical protein